MQNVLYFIEHGDDAERRKIDLGAWWLFQLGKESMMETWNSSARLLIANRTNEIVISSGCISLLENVKG